MTKSLTIEQLANVGVAYKFIDGAHFFVPADKRVSGLCVASTDLETARIDAGEQIYKIATFGANRIEIECDPITGKIVATGYVEFPIVVCSSSRSLKDSQCQPQ